MNIRKRLFAFMLAFTMVLTYMPALAFADTSNSDSDGSSGYHDFQQGDDELLVKTSTAIKSNAYNSDDIEVNLEIKSASVENYPDKEGETVVELFNYEPGYWEYYSVNTGYAIVNVVYQDSNGKEIPHSFKVTVVDEQFFFGYNYTDGTDIGLPGTSINLDAYATRSFIFNDRSVEEDATDQFTYEWALEKDGISDQRATLTPDGNKVKVNFNSDNDQSSGVFVALTVKNSEGDVVYEQSIQTMVSLSYEDIFISDYDKDLEIGDSTKVTVELRHYADGTYSVVDGVRFTLDDYDSDYISVDKDTSTNNPSTFTFTKKDPNPTSAWVTAEYTTEDGYETSVEKTISFNNKYRDFMFEDADDFQMGSEERTFTLNTDYIQDDLENGYKINYKVGEWEWNDVNDFTKYYDSSCYTVSGNKITLHGSKLIAAGAECICIRAELIRESDNNVCDYTDINGDIYGGGSDEPEDPAMIPESMYFSSATELMAVVGDSFINGNTFFMDGNLIEIIFQNGHKEKYNCISFPYVDEDGEETEYTGYFRDGKPDGDEITVDYNVEGGFKLGDNEVTLTANLDGTEVSTTVHVKGVESEDDIYNALKDDAEQSSADAASAAESDDPSVDTDAVISGAESVTDAAVKAADSAIAAANKAIEEAGDDAEAKAEAEAQLKAAEELKAATTQYKATARMASATVATKKAAAAKKAAASAAATPGQAAVNAAVASKAAADEAVDKAEKAKKAADDAVVAARTVYDKCSPEEQSAAREALNAATQAAAAADEALENANKAASEAADAVTDAQNKKAQKDAADAQAAAAQQAAAAEAARQGTLNTKLPKVSIKKPAAAKKAVTVKWKKLSKKNQKKAGKIEVWVCPNKAFAAADTVMKETGKKKASLKVKGLSKKKTYYVKVRSIQYVGGVKNVGKWSKVKTVKIR